MDRIDQLLSITFASCVKGMMLADEDENPCAKVLWSSLALQNEAMRLLLEEFQSFRSSCVLSSQN